MKILFILITAIIQCHWLPAQINHYTITGKIKKPITGKVYLFSVISDKKYYLGNSSIDSTNIIKGIFKIQRDIQGNYPYAYRLMIKSDSLSGTTGVVFIEPKDQTILINSINKYISPVIKNSKSENELKNEYEPFFKGFLRKAFKFENYEDQLYQRFKRKIPAQKLLELSKKRERLIETVDSLFFEYVRIHPNSYVSLWKLIERFKNYGYKDKYLNTYTLLSNNIKKSPLSQLLIDDLNFSKKLSINSIFPPLNLKDTSLKKVKLNIKKYNAKWILIDFWFSHCGPCLKDFPKYKNLYTTYANKGFEIIGISIDKKADIKDWKSVVRKMGLNWHQYLDEGGSLSEKFDINYFPTTFLLNYEGKIIKRNITPEELSNFLLKRLTYFTPEPLEPY